MICFTPTSKLTSSLTSLIKASPGVSKSSTEPPGISQYSGYTFGDTMLKLPEIYPQLKAALGGRFNLTILPAAQTTVDEYIEYMISKADEYDVLFVDYDSNFKPTQADNMYKEGTFMITLLN